MAEILGTGGADKIVGTAGRDTIVAGAGNDTIVGDGAVAKNMLVDGSFETANIGPNAWSPFKSVGGWQSDTGVEVWGKDFLGVKSTDGDKVMELDFDNKASSVWQDVETTEGETYTFSFDYSQRPGTAAATNTIEVWWNGKQVGVVDPTSTDWQQASFEVVGTGGKDRIEFREDAKDNDSLGGMIDNVALVVSSKDPSDMIDAGHGDDVVRGGNGDDFILGGSGNDKLYGQAGNDKMFGAGSLAGTVDMDKFRVAEAVKGSVTFVGESAGYKNALGVYKIAADGSIYDVDVLFANASLKGSGGDLIANQSKVDLALEAGDKLGFFVVPDGFSQKGMDKLLADAKGEFKFVDAAGNAGTVNGGALKLVHVDAKGNMTDIKSAYGTEVFHSLEGTSGKLNADGLQHVHAEVDVATGTVKIGFEDLKGGGDKDFDDSVFLLDIGQTNAALLAREGTGGTPNDDDVMTGGAGNDTMFGMAGSDVTRGGAGDDLMWGNSGDDKMFGGAGNDTMSGGSGNDDMRGGAGNDTMSGNTGDDVMRGGAGDDVMAGNSGNDVMFDGAGNDKVDGGSGDDVFVAGAGDDSYVGGSGFDTLDFSVAKNGLTIDMSKHTAVGLGNDTFWSVEGVVGGQGDDTIKGDKRDNAIDGGDGNDALRGMGGVDVLTGGKGADTFSWLAKDVMNGAEHLGVDTITDFSAADGDTLDFSRMIAGSPDSLDGLVELTETKQGTMVSVMIDKAFVEVVMLQDVHGLDANAMLKDGLILA